MLSDQEIERYSRQIVLPEVGGRGQARLCAASVSLGGDGPAASTTALLLERAGVGTLHRSPGVATADVDVGLSEPDGGVPFALEPATRPLVLGILRDGRIAVATLVGRPCRRCWLQALRPDELDAEGARADEHRVAALQLALGALVASETLRILIAPPPRGRLTSLDLEHGRVAARDLESPGCSCCSTTP